MNICLITVMLLTRCTCTCICAVVAVMLNTGNKASNKELVQHASFNHKKQAAFKTVTTVLWSKLSINVLDKMCLFYWIYIYILLKKKIYIYTGCPRRNVPDFGRVFLMLKYTHITQNTHVQSWMVTKIMTREVWNFDSCYTLIDYQIHIKTGRNMWFL